MNQATKRSMEIIQITVLQADEPYQAADVDAGPNKKTRQSVTDLFAQHARR
jgi:hypothetical protein